jgi:hypothetical protein
MRRTSLWTVIGIVAVAGALLSLPGARTDAGLAPAITGYRCYAAKNAKGFKFNKTVLYAVKDQLGGTNVTTLLSKPAVVCSSAVALTQTGNFNFTLVQALPTLVCFKTKDAKGTPKLNFTSFQALDDLGFQNLSLGRANLFCVALPGYVMFPS